ncbi:hypothetical protein GCM10028807_21160 [Spirosoma daeguense]
MKNIFIYLCSLATLAGLLWSCETWDLPGKKTKRNCIKPSGTLNTQMQQRRVDFSVTNASGTIDKVVWDFGNGNVTNTTSLTYTYIYPQPNTYTVKVTLTNACGIETTLQQSLAVSDAIPPTVTLQPITNIYNTSAVAGMTITSAGNAAIIRYGICYSSTNQEPVPASDSKEEVVGSAPVNISIPLSLSNLQPNTLYYARSYAYNAEKGPGYSPVVTFRTGFSPDIIIESIGAGISTATVNFRVNSLGSPAVTSYGICFSEKEVMPEIQNSISRIVTDPKVGVNLADLKGLIPNTKYYYRLFTIQPNTNKPVYGNAATFNTTVDPVKQDLVAAISFSDQSLQDESGFNNHIKLVGNPTFTTDHTNKANSAILLDGIDDYIYMPENSNNSLNPEALSISIWIKPAPLTHRMQIYNKSRYENSANEVYSSLLKKENDVGPGTTIMTDIKQGSNCEPGKGWQSFPVTSSIEMDVWHHLVFTYTGNTARMYIDGALLSVKNDLPANKIDVCPGAELKFGAAIKGLNWFFKGAMDDIRIYKRALTSTEVQTLHNQ